MVNFISRASGRGSDSGSGNRSGSGVWWLVVVVMLVVVTAAVVMVGVLVVVVLWMVVLVVLLVTCPGVPLIVAVPSPLSTIDNPEGSEPTVIAKFSPLPASSAACKVMLLSCEAIVLPGLNVPKLPAAVVHTGPSASPTANKANLTAPTGIIP